MKCIFNIKNEHIGSAYEATIPKGFSSTSCIKHLAVSALSSGTARIKSSCNLIGNRFEMPNVSYTQPLPAMEKDDTNSLKHKY